MDLNCALCYHPYELKIFTPRFLHSSNHRMLKCGHTFCENCLKDLKDNGQLACPVCRSYFASDTNQLMKNLSILSTHSQVLQGQAYWRSMIRSWWMSAESILTKTSSSSARKTTRRYAWSAHLLLTMDTLLGK